MKKYVFISIISFLWIANGSAQLTVNTGLSSTALANLLTGFGVNITNVQINCNSNSYGEFGGTSEIPIHHGLMLSTGNIDDIIGPNTSTSTGTDNGFGGYFPLSNELGGVQTYDACVISFDCVPSGDTLLFNFAFGSEEYLEYVGSEYNDIFAIYFSDSTGIVSNAALIPNSSSPVSINNVNHLINSSYYIYNTTGVYVGFDGLTQNLQAFAVVVPGNTYHYTIAIADVADGIYDSGVLLEAFSFRSTPIKVNVEEELSNSFVIYPIPANDHLQIQSKTTLPIESIMITDALGRILLNENLQSTSAIIDVSSFPHGLYLLTGYTSKGKFTRKIMIE